METKSIDLEDHLPSFEGRVLFIYLNAKKALLGHYVVSPHFEMQGGRLYLVGTTPDEDKPPNHPICIAWERVEAYIVADSMDAFHSSQVESSDADDGE